MYTYRVEIIRHDLEYDAIIAVNSKKDIKKLLNISNNKLKMWKVTKNPDDIKAATLRPGKVLARPSFINDDYSFDSYVEIDTNFTI